MKAISIGELFTAAEMQRARKLYKECDGIGFAARCDLEIVAPVLSRINARTGQENDSRYFAYAIEYALTQTKGR